LIVDADVDATANIATSKLQVPVIGTPTHNTVQEYFNTNGSPGLIDGAALTEGTALTLDVSATKAIIRATNSETVELKTIDVAAVTGLALTADTINYIYIEYNLATPQVVATTTERTDHNTNIFLGNVYKNATELHINEYDGHYIGNFAHNVMDRLRKTEPFLRESGAIISEIGTRNIAVTAGAFWEGIREFTTSAFDSSATDNFSYWYRDGIGGWTKVATQTQIDNTQYDDGDGTLAALTSNKYGVHWIYLGVDAHIDVIYGRGNYAIDDAQNAQPPADIPPSFESHSRIIGKIIIKEAETVFTQTESTFDLIFVGSGASDHGSLIGLGDDDHTQYHNDTRGDARYLQIANNLSDLNSAATARTNLGVAIGSDVAAYDATNLNASSVIDGGSF